MDSRPRLEEVVKRDELVVLDHFGDLFIVESVGRQVDLDVRVFQKTLMKSFGVTLHPSDQVPAEPCPQFKIFDVIIFVILEIINL